MYLVFIATKSFYIAANDLWCKESCSLQPGAQERDRVYLTDQFGARFKN